MTFGMMIAVAEVLEEAMDDAFYAQDHLRVYLETKYDTRDIEKAATWKEWQEYKQKEEKYEKYVKVHEDFLNSKWW